MSPALASLLGPYPAILNLATNSPLNRAGFITENALLHFVVKMGSLGDLFGLTRHANLLP